MDFNDVADFENANFNGKTIYDDANFLYADFNSSADFFNADFNMLTYFENSDFNSSANFASVKFNMPTYFESANFNSSANFASVKFNSVSFCTENAETWLDYTDEIHWAIFNDDTNFNNANFNSQVYFMKENFNISSKIQPPDTSENIITIDRKACEIFMASYNNEARYADKDNIYYNYRKFEQGSKDIRDISKWTDILSWITCGFGTKLEYTILWIIGIILFFAFVYRIQHTTVVVEGIKNKVEPIRVYYKESGIYKSSEEYKRQKSMVSFRECLYFSINTFTTLGSSKWSHKDELSYAVTIEGILGWVMLAVFLATLMHLLMRP